IFLEEARVIAHEACAGKQFILKLEAPKCAQAAAPGSFVHLTCDPALPMRRPLSIMRANPQRGSIELLYKVVGGGLDRLSRKKPGDTLSTLGPIGTAFVAHPERPRTLLVGGGVGSP